MATGPRKPAVSQRRAAVQRVPEELRPRLVRDQARIARFFSHGDMARTGSTASSLIDAVAFPDFVSDLIGGVFNSIVDASIEQMRAYAELVANVARSVDQFSQDHVTDERGREWLAESYPDLLLRDGRIRVRDGVDLRAVLAKINQLPVEGSPLTELDEESEQRLAAAAARHMEAERRRKLAETLLLGVNRIVVEGGRFRARAVFDGRSGQEG
jgi:hypothetical protein